MGFECVDLGWVDGTMGDVPTFFLWNLHRSDMWPLEQHIADFSEDDVFDVIELLFDNASFPIETEGAFHSYSGCGWHYQEFDVDRGQADFRDAVNRVLSLYSSGYELDSNGEIRHAEWPGVGRLLEQPLPEFDASNVNNRVDEATSAFLSRNSSIGDRRDAVRRLADVLEFLRPRLREAISKKDEGDLFAIANEFGIRHHNDKQKTDYDARLWLSWIFYHYLATIHLAVRRIQAHDRE